MEKVVALCKRRGFVFPNSEIYGGFANSWDYGPYGVQLKKNIADHWWKTFVQKRQDVVGLDSSIIMHPRIWEASGHVGSFSDPLVEDKETNKRYRLDHLLEEQDLVVAGWSVEKLWEKAQEIGLKSPDGNELSEPRQFNLMFKTFQGVIEETASEVYMRPETAQGIFINFKNVIQNCRVKVPFGIAQIGKAFRNEITPGNFTYRTREFEQMEIEYFVSPQDEDSIQKMFEEWKETSKKWFTAIGIGEENLRYREHEADELSHYSSMTFDIEYKFPFGWGELMGLAYRGCFDLSQHQEFSGEDLQYRDPQTNEKYVPHVIEPSFGLSRTTLIALLDAYDEDEIDGESRVVMRFAPAIAPVKAAIFPLMKKDGLPELAQEIFTDLSEDFALEYDESGSVGKRYRRQDEIGTPYCITVDYDSLEDKTVTIRHRDTAKQERVAISELREKIKLD